MAGGSVRTLQWIVELPVLEGSIPSPGTNEPTRITKRWGNRRHYRHGIDLHPGVCDLLVLLR